MNTVEGIQRMLQFNFALLDRLPRRAHTETKERTRLQNRIRDLRAELAQARARVGARARATTILPSPAQPFPMKRIARHIDQDGGQMLFTYRRTRAERIAAGELQEVSERAKAGGFRWPLAVTADLWRDVQTIPHSFTRSESVPARWQHVFLLASTAAAQILRDGLPELRINVVLRTTAGPGKSREHIKHLCLLMERADEGEETFVLGYCALN